MGILQKSVTVFVISIILFLCPIAVYGADLYEFKDVKTSGFIDIVKVMGAQWAR